MKEKICLVVSSPMTVSAFLQQPIRRLCTTYDVYVALNINPGESLGGLEDMVTILPVVIERKIAPWRDLMALWKIVMLFRRHRFKLVHSVTPKAGLLAMLAAFLAGVDIRIHTFTGQVWVTRHGAARLLLKNMDKLIALLATFALADSPSQRQFLLDEGVVTASGSGVLAQGSISGVDTIRFRPDSQARDRLREELRITEADTLFLFLGRLNRDKGVLDLATAFSGMGDERAHLLFVGPDEGELGPQLRRLTEGCEKRVHFVGYAEKPEEYMAAADVLCLPSYREGFGNVVIEAAAVGIPAIGTRIYGVEDAIQEHVSGSLFAARDVAALREAMRHMVDDREWRLQLGRQARERVIRDFSSDKLAAAWLAFYQARV
jgi:glycosyltransferase involved in cell wall biosynthesis